MYGMKKETLETVVKELREAREALVVKLADLDKIIETLEVCMTMDFTILDTILGESPRVRMYPGESLAAVKGPTRRAVRRSNGTVSTVDSSPQPVAVVPDEEPGELREGSMAHQFLALIRKKPLSSLELCAALKVEVGVVYAVASVLRKKGLTESRLDLDGDGTRRYFPVKGGVMKGGR